MLTTTPYPYQVEGLNMLLERQRLLVAMDMGLGKTLVSIAAAEHLLGEGEVSTVLIAAPAGLLIQWAGAIAAHTDVDTRWIRAGQEQWCVPTEDWCVLMSGTAQAKRKQIERIKADSPQYVVASYDTVAQYAPLFSRTAQMVVIDEATVLKGFRSRQAKRLRSLDVPWRVALTGTPVENHRPEEAWAIMRWVDPDLFDDWPIFERAYIRRNRFGKPVRYVNMPVLHAKLSTTMFRKRRTDPDVRHLMPEVTYEKWDVNLTGHARVLYEHILNDMHTELQKAGLGADFSPEAYYDGTDRAGGAGKVGAIQIAAQMLLDHPALLRQSASSFELGQNMTKSSNGSAYAAGLAEAGLLDAPIETPKLDVLVARVSELLAADPDNKIIIVSRFRGMLDLIADAFPLVEHVRFHGQMTPALKAQSIGRFQDDPDVRLMVMSHAGAYGVDLPAGSHLVNVDPARSSGQGKQIDARHIRINSQHENVQVIHMITRATIEERHYELLALKDRVASAITDGEGADKYGVIHNTVTPLTRHVASELARAA